MDSKIIAVDFDGTLCENKWPEIGEANKEIITYLKGRQANGDKLILWTCRVDDMLKNAVDWSAKHGLIFEAVNENLPEIVVFFGTDTRKIFANEYIDDRNAWYYPNQTINENMPQSERMELWGNLIDIVEDWLTAKGITADDILNEGREGVEDAAIIFGEDYDYFANQFANVIGISRDFMEVNK